MEETVSSEFHAFFGEDSIRHYLKEIRKISRLPESEQRKITETIEELHAEIKRALASIPYALHRFLFLAEQVKKGQILPEELLLPQGRDGADKAKSVLGQLARVRKLDREIAQFQSQASKRCGSFAGCAPESLQIARRRNAIQEILADLPIQPSVIEELLAELRSLNEQIAELKTRPQETTQDDLRELERRLSLPSDEFQEVMSDIAERIQKLNQVKRSLVEANLGLVVYVAKRYQRYLNGDLALSDLIQEGNIGLMQAVGRFQVRRGSKFSSYAVWWIRQAITRTLVEQSNAIRIPAHVAKNRSRLSRLSQALVGELGREPTREEVAERAAITPELLQSLEECSRKTISLGTRVGEDTELCDFLEDDRTTSPVEALCAQDLRFQVRRALETLSKKEREILCFRFGIDCEGNPANGTHTFRELTRRFSVSAERIRQIEIKALLKLRRVLRPFFNTSQGFA